MLRAEVLAIEQPLTFEYLRSLKYLRYVINEGMSVSPSFDFNYFVSDALGYCINYRTEYAKALLALRLVLPASRTLRTCLRTTVLPSGGGPTGTAPILAQPGTQTDTNFRAMHLDPSI